MHIFICCLSDVYLLFVWICALSVVFLYHTQLANTSFVRHEARLTDASPRSWKATWLTLYGFSKRREKSQLFSQLAHISTAMSQSKKPSQLLECPPNDAIPQSNGEDMPESDGENITASYVVQCFWDGDRSK